MCKSDSYKWIFQKKYIGDLPGGNSYYRDFALLVTLWANSGPGRCGRLFLYTVLKVRACFAGLLETYLKDRENSKSLSFNGIELLIVQM